MMAGRSRVPSSELEPDLSSPTSAKKLKLAEASDEGVQGEEFHLVEENVETKEKLAASERSLSGAAQPSASTSISTVKKSFEVLRQVADSELTKASGSATAASTSREEPQGSVTGTRSSETEAREQIQYSLMGEHALYQELSLIGNGAYGTVYKAKDLVSGQVVALKKVRVPLTEDGLPMSTLREIAALKQLERFEHPNIVRLLDVCQGNYLQLPSSGERSDRSDRGLTLWLVFEHVEKDLASFISSYRKADIPAVVIRQMSKEILLGVEFLHTHRILHRDLKPQNLLVTKEGRIKIADFGLAKTYDFEMRLTSVVVTLWYRAPEVLLGCSYATPVDIWSVGCILAELCRLEPLFPGTSEGDQLDRIFQILGTPPQKEWPENVSLSWTAFPYRRPKSLKSIIPDLTDDGLDLVKNLLTFNPHNRLTAAQALRHRYFADNNG